MTRHLTAAFIAVGLTLAACTKPIDPFAVIYFKQLGVCTRAQTGNGVINVPPSHAIVIFRVSHIDNTSTGKTWSFDSTALQINTSEVQQNLGGPGPVSIGSGKDVPVNLPVGIMVETANADGSDAASVNYFLLYPGKPPAPGTLGVKENSSQVQYPFTADCALISGI